MNFSTSEGFYEYKNGYIVEYDIFLTEQQIDELGNNNLFEVLNINKTFKTNKVSASQHYTANNLVNGGVIKVYMDNGFGSYMQSAFDEALKRYNDLGLRVRFERTNDSNNAGISILSFYEQSIRLGFSSGFPVNGRPATPIKLNTYYYDNYRADAATVIAHEIGHAIGFRHTDFMNRSFSCGVGGNEDVDYPNNDGANHIPGTPTGAEYNSWMLACSGGYDRPFTTNDVIALVNTYGSFLLEDGNEWLNGPYNYTNYSFISGDVNGDGKTDVIGINPSDERFLTWISNGSGFNTGYEGLNGPYNYGNYKFISGDVNGDGKTDIIGIDPNDERFLTWISNGIGFNAGNQWINGSHSYGNYKFISGDVNGDGKTDVIGIDPNNERFLTWLSNGNGFNAGNEWLNGPYSYSNYSFVSGDVNGDSKVDIIGINPNDERLLTWLSNGNGFNAGNEWLNGPYVYGNYSFISGDVNGDGKTDVIGVDPKEERFIGWYSNGSGFNDGRQLLNGAYKYEGYIFIPGDVNGDGKTDNIGINPTDERFLTWITK